MANPQDVTRKPPRRNPVFQMLGLPKFRLRLPSRNWMIFLSITGSFAAAVTYDRRQKKKVQQKWCDLVSHLALESLPVNQMRRKLTVYLESPPGDTLGVSRQYFRDYVKPVLVAAALDYEVIEGRKEGEIRYGTAERIRHQRRKMEHLPQPSENEASEPEQLVEDLRQRVGIIPEAGIRGDLVVGRHTWKEYIRGLHEGWLGPLDPPQDQGEPSSNTHPEPSKLTDKVAESQVQPRLLNTTLADESNLFLDQTEPTSEARSEPQEPIDRLAESQVELDLVDAALTDANPMHENSEERSDTSEKEPTRQEEKERPFPPASYLPVHVYASSTPSPTLPDTLEPSNPIPQPHILGFLNTPIRIYRYLNQRHLADDVGRQVAAIALGTSRSYHTFPIDDSTAAIESGLDAPQSHARQPLEQQQLLGNEESEWHKSVRKPKVDGSERVWLDKVIVDPRIGERMRKFMLEDDALPEHSTVD